MFSSKLHLIITVYVLALVAPNFVDSLAISSNPTIIPATLPLTSPVHALAPRTTTCGTGYCPQGSTCCSNNTCCPSTTLCTRTPSNVVGCCPVGTVCDGTPAGYGEAVDGGSMLSSDQPESQDEGNVTSPGDENGNTNQTTASNTVDNVNSDAADNGNGTTISEASINAADSTATAVATETAATAAAEPDVGATTIIGAVAGGIVGWMALCAGLFWLHKRYRASHPKTEKRALPPPPAAGVGRMAFPQGFVRIEDAASEVGVGGKAPRPYTTVYGPGARV
ncbi:uncharacterized protein LAJ45_04785 [Morchella importuna]|uniref:uncharacterized protein n=1 Tax=Morchella importuna TaxID=1174673 RepID=UPI001E8ED13B|nr:uncharacterized protein LAJ45_04785 [Morchella importuna]KAH8151083.1 hypothetical protein LAJ45_04785 [Morchella importuna]